MVEKNLYCCTDTQFGFIPGCGTTDAIFALHTVNTKTLGTKRNCCFIEYCKAFDSVNETKLLYKLAHSGITGKMYSIVL